MLWEVDTTKVPDKPEERIENWTTMLNMVKEALDSCKMTDWGEFAGRTSGYAVNEGTEQEIAVELLRYVPYIKVQVVPCHLGGSVLENVKALSQA